MILLSVHMQFLKYVLATIIRHFPSHLKYAALLLGLTKTYTILGFQENDNEDYCLLSCDTM